MPDRIFDDARLAALYDPLDPDRSDLDVYAALVAELGARRVLDVGCGTGTFACLLAGRGYDVTGVDPARASLEVARAKPHADRVCWVHGDATTLPGDLRVDVAIMTANVAQVFVTDDDWAATLRGIHAVLVAGGRLVFETRDPAREAWRAWTREHTHARTVVGEETIESWCDLVAVEGDVVTFRWTYLFEDRTRLTSDSSLRFRHRSGIVESLSATGFVVEEVRDAPDRPGKELVFVARAQPSP